MVAIYSGTGVASARVPSMVGVVTVCVTVVEPSVTENFTARTGLPCCAEAW
jgi:hypothetical protein